MQRIYPSNSQIGVEGGPNARITAPRLGFASLDDKPALPEALIHSSADGPGVLRSGHNHDIIEVSKYVGTGPMKAFGDFVQGRSQAKSKEEGTKGNPGLPQRWPRPPRLGLGCPSGHAPWGGQAKRRRRGGGRGAC